MIEGSVNGLVLAAKLAVGLSTGSLAVLGDAVHSLTDLANNLVAWFVIRLSARPPDPGHPYGHRKFETLAVFGLATLLAVLALELALQAFRRGTPDVVHDDWALAVMLGVLGVNIAVAAWQRYWARRLGSDILLADANHTLADVLTTMVVIGGWQLSAHGYPWLDSACALAVAGLVMVLAAGLFRRALPALVDASAVPPDRLARIVAAVPGVRAVGRVRSRWIGARPAVDLVIIVDRALPTADAHAVADAVEAALETEFGAHDVSIHIEPEQPGTTEDPTRSP